MFSVDLIDDLLSEGGVQEVLQDFLTQLAAGRLMDVLFGLLPYLIGLIIFYSIAKGILKSIFSGISASKGAANSINTASEKFKFDFGFGGSLAEDPTDKAQRLLGDGEYIKAAKFLRGYLKSNPEDLHGKALYEIATDYAGASKKAEHARQQASQASRTPEPRRHSPRPKVAKARTPTPTQTKGRKIAELGAGLINQAVGHKLTKEQMVHFAKTGKLPGQ